MAGKQSNFVFYAVATMLAGFALSSPFQEIAFASLVFLFIGELFKSKLTGRLAAIGLLGAFTVQIFAWLESTPGGSSVEVSKPVFGFLMIFLVVGFGAMFGISELLKRDLERLSLTAKTRSEERSQVMDLAATNKTARRARSYYFAMDTLFWSMFGAVAIIFIVEKVFGNS